MRTSSIASLVTAAAGLSLAAAAFAEPLPFALPRVARLSYLIGPGAKGCPAEQVFRMSVRAQSDRDVLVPEAPARLRVGIERRAKEGRYAVTIDLDGEAGEALVHRTLASFTRCLDATEAAAVVVVELLDPIQAPAPPPPAPSPVLPARPAALPPRSADEASVLSFHAGLGTWLGLGVGPRPAAGLSGEIGLRWSPLLVSAELRWDPPASAEVGGARLSTWRLLGGVVPCGHWSRNAWGLFGCGVVQAGEIWGEAEGMPGAGSVGAPLVAAGGRLGGELRLSSLTPHLGLRLAGDLMGQVLGGSFVLGPQAKWTMPRLTGDVGLSVIALW